MKFNNKYIYIISMSLLLLLFSVKNVMLKEPYRIKSGAKIVLSDNLDMVYGDIYYISDFVSIEDGELNDFRINYDDLGKKKVKYTYKYHGSIYEDAVILNVIDNISPIVMLNNSLSVYVNETDVANKVLCADNYDRNPSCMIEGDYDISKVGDYKVKYVAKDVNNNVTSRDFVLHVKEKKNGNNNKTMSNDSRTMISDVISKYKTNDTLIGIDVSRYQGKIDWKMVKESGVSFAVIRMGGQDGFEGDMFTDRTFVNNINGAIQNDIKVGLYFYSYASSVDEAKKQANWMLDKIKDYKIDLPIVFDWENFGKFNSLNLSLYDITNIQNEFLNVFKERGYDTSRYASKSYLTNVWLASEHKTWLAHYVNNTTYQGDYFMWQLCNNGVVDGIIGNVDIDVLYLNK